MLKLEAEISKDFVRHMFFEGGDAGIQHWNFLIVQNVEKYTAHKELLAHKMWNVKLQSLMTIKKSTVMTQDSDLRFIPGFNGQND